MMLLPQQRSFSIRIQQGEKLISENLILAGQLKIELQKDYQLYLDPNPKGIAKASISYEAIKNA